MEITLLTQIEQLLHHISVEEEEIDGEIDAEVEGKEMMVSLNVSSVVGIGSPRRMKMVGELMSRKVVVLIDSGATHNFLSDKLVEELKILVKAAEFTVVLKDDSKMKGVGNCEGVTILLQDIAIAQNFLPFSLRGVDVILGMNWLHRLGEVKTNWKKQTMEFTWEGKKTELKGNLALTLLKASFKALMKVQ